MKKFLLLVLISLSSTLPVALALGTGDRLDLAITPIRVDISAIAAQTTNGSVTLYNNSDQPYSFVMSAEDCTVTSDYKAPLCTPPDTSSMNSNSLASWITFDTTGLFTIAPKGKRIINYTIHTPANAIPGGHYGAIFFNSPDTGHGGTISMNRRIGSLLLVTVPGDIIVAPEFGSVLVDSQGGGGGPSGIAPNTGLFTFNQTGSLLEQATEKGKQLMMTFTDPTLYEPILESLNPFWSAPDIDPNTSFTTSLGIPVENKGTIHIVPTGKVTLYSPDGSQLTHIGKELIKNQNGAIIGEKVVDYLTINEESGNILPGTSRTFMMNWYGFAHESIGPDGTIIIDYETPGAYYSRIAREQSGFLYPWEKLAYNHTTDHLTAKIDLSYVNPVTGKNVSYTPTIPLTIEYNTIKKTWNTGLITPILCIILLWWWVAIWRKRRYHYNIHNTLIGEDGDTEIAVLERAKAMIDQTKQSTRAVKKTTTSKQTPTPTVKKATTRKKTTPGKKETIKQTDSK